MITFNAVISKSVAKNVDNVETMQKRTLIQRGKNIIRDLEGLGFLWKNYGSVKLRGEKKLHQKSQNDGTRTYNVYF